MSKVDAKKLIIPAIYVFAILLIIASIILVTSSLNKYLTIPKDYDYTISPDFETTVEVMNQTEMIIRPYTSQTVEVGKYFYDFEATEEEQKNSLIFYENTYMQNSGVDYISESTFEVVSVLDGEVISIEEDKTLGNIVKIKHEQNIITVYQGIEDVKVEKNAQITQGTIIGTSGTSKINANYKNALHFEVFYNGELIDPESFYTLNIKDL